ncbi:MAG TPA: DUF542 domain-containing protein [Candidatus Dwaynia gallinarum]|nr:DUF542 domain-containing protein [Candidatus Dwaynia gallinarum]
MLDEKVGDILNKFPSTKTFFDKYNIDYCCNGRKVLKDALKELNIDNQNIVNELIHDIQKACEFKSSNSDEVVKSTDFINKSSEEVIDFVINHFHEGLRKTMPEINALILKIMRAHIKHHKQLFWKIHELFCKIKDIFEGHLILEEENIFKEMIKFNNGELSKESEEYKTMIETITEAVDEHFIIGPTLKELTSLTNNYSVPENSCETVKKVYEELHKLQDHILAHTQIENNILFPRYLTQN